MELRSAEQALVEMEQLYRTVVARYNPRHHHQPQQPHEFPCSTTGIRENHHNKKDTDHGIGNSGTSTTSTTTGAMDSFRTFNSTPIEQLRLPPLPNAPTPPNSNTKLVHLTENAETIGTTTTTLASTTTNSTSTVTTATTTPMAHRSSIRSDTNNNNNNNHDMDHGSRITATETILTLSNLRQQIEQWNHQYGTKLQKRCRECDPITGQSRYGETTRKRVEIMLTRYQQLYRIIQEEIFGNSTDDANTDTSASENDDGPHNNHKNLRNRDTGNLADTDDVDTTTTTTTTTTTLPAVTTTTTSLFRRLQEQSQQEQVQEEEQQQIREQERIEREAIRAMELERQRLQIIDLEVQRQRDNERQREQIRQQAEQIRRTEERMRQEQEQADRSWVNSITPGLAGVRDNLRILLDETSHDPRIQLQAVTALHTLFSQIAGRPEEVNFRRVRRDHPRFNEEIGKYPGGKEILIAAGFTIGRVDEIPSFVLKEPNIETEMDAWSAWFDLIKGTVQILEEQLVLM